MQYDVHLFHTSLNTTNNLCNTINIYKLHINDILTNLREATWQRLQWRDCRALLHSFCAATTGTVNYRKLHRTSLRFQGSGFSFMDSQDSQDTKASSCTRNMSAIVSLLKLHFRPTSDVLLSALDCSLSRISLADQNWLQRDFLCEGLPLWDSSICFHHFNSARSR